MNPPTQKRAKWVAEYRAPEIEDAATDLAFYSYNSISVVSPSVVFVAGTFPDPKNSDGSIGFIARTTDAGATWTKSFLQGLTTKITTLNSIRMVSPTTGWAAGANDKRTGYLLRTTDAGNTWRASKLESKEIPTAIVFQSVNRGWIAGTTHLRGDPDSEGGPSEILGTNDGGNTWLVSDHIPVSVEDLAFTDEKNGWAACEPAGIYHTSDGGLSWDRQTTGLETALGPGQANSAAIIEIDFSDPAHGWAIWNCTALNQSLLIGTADGGKTWAQYWRAPEGETLRAVYFLNSQEGWLGTQRSQYVYHSIDGGHHWTVEPVNFEEQMPLYRIAAADADHIWAVGGGAIFRRVAQ